MTSIKNPIPHNAAPTASSGKNSSVEYILTNRADELIINENNAYSIYKKTNDAK